MSSFMCAHDYLGQLGVWDTSAIEKCPPFDLIISCALNLSRHFRVHGALTSLG